MPLTLIEWAHYVFNTWWGCVRVSRACDGCYAEKWAKWRGKDGLWLPHGPRWFPSDAVWRGPARWNRDAAAAGKPRRVFSGSMCDVFERHPVVDMQAMLDAARIQLWMLCETTPWLVWLLLTKRPQNILRMVPPHWLTGGWPANVWVGASIESQEWVRPRGTKLLRVPAPVRFLSCEPLVERLDLSSLLTGDNRVEWVIAGGESGHGAVPSHPAWFTGLRDQCTDADIPFFFKQWGEWGVIPNPAWPADDATRRPLRHQQVADTPGFPADVVPMYRVGKKAAGRVLDSREWSQVPPMPVPVAA